MREGEVRKRGSRQQEHRLVKDKKGRQVGERNKSIEQEIGRWST